MYIQDDILDLHFAHDGRDIVRKVKVLAKQNGDGVTTLIFELIIQVMPAQKAKVKKTKKRKKR